MNIQLQLENASLNITEGNDNHIEMAIRGFFGVCGYSVEQTDKKVEPQAIHKSEIKATDLIETVATKVFIPGGVNERTRQLPLIGSTKTLTQKPFETLSDAAGLPQTNIRETDNGLKLYKSHYMCPACGNEGTRYNRESNWYMKCHDCDTKIAQEAATFEKDINDIPVPDKDGNFFIGRDFYLEEDLFKESK
ncbi:hypothetical protein [Rummeliibacillus stabekisii]|uniref:Uncharacterized protein n=1 Tax=Rummeliibacillus stabekisii TaxID=241244 RepID=A0A143H9K6_9BACL|nr:hypothetical protein [Rummeliibacillus stabekisii]AMW98427.1 hypothetical protein ATY39_02660 [Rummeliibacillus stabekisii]AMW99228.1 hypothetical protein ATY39_06965 [Rummeliibacillus stabekisii]